MTYKGYEITAVVETTDAWTVDGYGNLVEAIENSASEPVVRGYNIYFELGDAFSEYVEGDNFEVVKKLIDQWGAAA